MPRIHCAQLFYSMNDAGMEDMPYDLESARRFAGLSLNEPPPEGRNRQNFHANLDETPLVHHSQPATSSYIRFCCPLIQASLSCSAAPAAASFSAKRS